MYPQEKIVKRLHLSMKGKKIPLSILDFHMTDGCNQSCKFCNFIELKKSFAGTPMKDNQYYDLVKEAYNFGAYHVNLCGSAEPFFKKKRTLKIISLAKELKMSCSLITNGTLFDESDIKNLVKLDMDLIRFSVHGSDFATHDYLVGLPGSFYKITKSIELFNFWKKKMKKECPHMSVYFVLNKRNSKNLDKLLYLMQSLNINELELSDVDIKSPDCKTLKLDEYDKKRLASDLSNLRILATKLGIKLYIQDSLFSKKKVVMKDIFALPNLQKMFPFPKLQKENNVFLQVPCYEPWYHIIINGYGKILVCGAIGSEFHNMYLNKRKLKDIWYGHEYKKIREKVLNMALAYECQTCCNDRVTFEIREGLKTILKSEPAK
jgi:MoaA/NifB/PqqE/SkfB family radical SAM enzyme